MFTLTQQALNMVAKKRHAVTEIEITPEMIAAGADAAQGACGDQLVESHYPRIAEAVFSAMLSVSPQFSSEPPRRSRRKTARLGRQLVSCGMPLGRPG
jgi:hypothetical protein